MGKYTKSIAAAVTALVALGSAFGLSLSAELQQNLLAAAPLVSTFLVWLLPNEA